VSGADLDGDGKAEVVVGRPEKLPQEVGRVHVFYGAWLTDQLSADAVTLVPPAPPTIRDGFENVFETLVDPSDEPFEAHGPLGFGWIVDASCGDLGKPNEPDNPNWQPALDDKPDLLIHSEGAYGYGENDSSIVNGGALFAFMNHLGATSGNRIFDESEPVKLMTPRIKDGLGNPLYFPHPAARFGRGFLVADWQDVNGDPTRIVLSADPDRSVLRGTQMVVDSGAVFAFQVPLSPRFDPNDLDADHINAWGDFILLEPAEALQQNVQKDLTATGAMDPKAGSQFGAWMVAGRYDTSFPAQELIIAARSRDVRIGSTVYDDLGRVYTVTLPTP
jgi:hypothetical protein